MNKKLLKEFQLQAGGAHYPDINPQLQEQFADQIVKYCIDIVENADLQDLVRTSWDKDFSTGVQQRIAQQIKNDFYEN